MGANGAIGMPREHVVFIQMTPVGILKIFVFLFFIKLRNQFPDKQINAYKKTCADKYINSEHPPPGKSGIGNQPVEKKIVKDVIRPMDKSDENKIKHEQENTHCHAEQADKGEKLPVLLKRSQKVKCTYGTENEESDGYEDVGRIHHQQQVFQTFVCSIELKCAFCKQCR
jgi:hypothetical protein